MFVTRKGDTDLFQGGGIKSKAKKKKKAVFFFKMTSMGVGVKVLKKVGGDDGEIGEFCGQIVSGRWEKHFWKRMLWGAEQRDGIKFWFQ